MQTELVQSITWFGMRRDGRGPPGYRGDMKGYGQTQKTKQRAWVVVLFFLLLLLLLFFFFPLVVSTERLSTATGSKIKKVRLNEWRQRGQLEQVECGQADALSDNGDGTKCDI